MKKDELKYDVTETDESKEIDESKETDDYELNESVEDEEEDPEKKARRRKNVIRILIGLGIIIALLLLGFGIKKNRIAAVIGDDMQNEMIGKLSNYVSQISADYVSEDEAKDIATNVIKDNFNDLLIENFMDLEQDNIQMMIDNSLYNYMQDYYTSAETDSLIQDAVDDITNLFMADIEELRRNINDVKTSVENLTNEFSEYQELTNKTLDEMSEKEQEDVDRLTTLINEHVAELQDKISIINSEIDIRDTETPLISYVWNTTVQKADSALNPSGDGSSSGSGSGASGDEGSEGNTDETASDIWTKWEKPADGINWTVTDKEHDKSNMTIKEYVEVLAQNDIEFTQSINKLYEYANDLYEQESNDRTEADVAIVNLFNSKVTMLQDEIDQINEKLNGISFWTGTQEEYNALGTKDPNTLYFVTD